MEMDEVTAIFEKGLDCAQCIVEAFKGELGDDYIPVMRSVSSMGMGFLQGAMCGAILGAIAVLGHRYGATSGDMSAKGLCIIKREQFFMELRKDCNGITCPEIIGLDIRNNDDNIKAFRDGVFDRICPALCLKIIGILEKI